MSALHVTDASFEKEVINSDLPVLVDCWAPWCGPCKMVGPIIDKLADEYAGKIKIVKLNVDENNATSAKYKISSIPTMMMIKDGKVVDGIIGAQPENAIREKLENWIK